MSIYSSVVVIWLGLFLVACSQQPQVVGAAEPAAVDAAAVDAAAVDTAALEQWNLGERDNSYRHYTYERTIEWQDDPVAGVVGSWDADGNHSNYGARHYRDAHSFIEDVLSTAE